MADQEARNRNLLRGIFTYMKKGWVGLLLLPFAGFVIHSQLPESVRSSISSEQVQHAINNFGLPLIDFMKSHLPDHQTKDESQLPDDQKKEKAPMIYMRKPMAPVKDNVALEEKQMFNVYDLKKCTAWDDVDPKFYEKLIDVTGRELNLTQDVTDAMKLAQHAGKVVNALEKFEQSSAGMFYFGRYETRRRPNKNMDIAVILYGFRWTLDDTDKETGEWLHSLTARQKDVCVKSFRSKAVEAFSEICPSELLKVVVDKEIKDSAGNYTDEDNETKEMFDLFQEWLEKRAKPAEFEAKM